jgi:hypothetical protein
MPWKEGSACQSRIGVIAKIAPVLTSRHNLFLAKKTPPLDLIE